MTVIPIITPLGAGDPVQIGPYGLLGRLGAGGMGQVFLGRSRDGALAAVKVVHAQYTADPRFRARFAREVSTARAVRGNGVAALLDADPDAPVPWLATEYVAGPSLERAVAAGGALPERSVAVLAARLAEALAALHDLGVVHRDVKPSNVLLAADGPKLIDFGIARAVDATALTHTGAVLGAPAFMSPEQALGDEAGTPSDVFSFASVLVFAALGRGPFGQSSTPVAILRRIVDRQPDLAGLPSRLRAELEPCFAKEPTDRPTAAELATGLMAHPDASGDAWPPPLVGGEPPTVPVAAAPPSGPPMPTAQLPPGMAGERPRSRLLSRRTLLTGAGVLAVSGIGWGVAAATGLVGGTRPVRWSFDADAAVGSVAVSDGILYAVSERGTVYALDPATGRPRWTFAMRPTSYGRLRAAPGLCLASDGPWLYALDAVSGGLRWTRERVDLRAVSRSLPVGIQYVDGDRALITLDPASGAPRWTCPLPEAENTIAETMVVTEGWVHATLDTRIYTVDAATGTPRWEQPLPADPALVRKLAAGPAALFTLTGRDVVRLDTASGAEVWHRQAPAYGNTPDVVRYPDIVASGTTVYLSGPDGLTAWDAATGDPRWATDQPSSDWQIHAPPVIGADTCYLIEQSYDRTDAGLVSRYRVAARSTEDGGARWTTPLDVTDDHLDVSMALSDDSLFIGTTIGLGDAATGTIHAISTG
jgi:outer membrane protein assembly factor BamB